MPAVAQAIAEAMQGRVGVLLGMVFELLQGDPDTAEGMRESMARGLPDLVGYLSNQMQAGRLRRMHPVLAIQLLAGPIVVHLLTRPLAEAVIGFQTPAVRTAGRDRSRLVAGHGAGMRHHARCRCSRSNL